MKTAPLIFVILAGGIFLGMMAVAQVPQGTHLARPSMPLYRQTSAEGKMLDCVVTGSSVSNLNAQIALVTDFELKNFRNGDAKQVQLTAQAPECEVDISSGVLSDAGHLQVFTPTTNLFVQGVGFLFVQSNHFLTLSNQVETTVVKSLLKSSKLIGERTNDTADSGQVVKIFARQGQFNFDSNVVDYAGDVHLIDPQLDMTCELLTIRFATNGGVENMLARHNVVLTTTNNGRATGATGFYYVTNGNEMMRLSTDAVWRNGDEEADADEFTYDSTRHVLTGTKVKVRWPNAAPNGHSGAVAPLRVGTNGFCELYADFAAMQFPPTNGPVESMLARGNVLIVNQADQDSATSERAVYTRVTDNIELTGNPVWWSTNMEVKADVLSANLGAKAYHARTNAHFKMRTAGGTAKPASGAAGRSTNQWLYISSADMEYGTDQAVFYRNVEARLVDNDRLQDTLNCSLLTLNLISNQVESAIASGNVHGATAPDPSGVIKTIACERLNAFSSVKTGRLESIDAHTNVVIEEKGTAPGAPYNTLAADTVMARFSPVTNQLEEAIAEQNVVFDQHKTGRTTHATAEHAIYFAGTNDEVKLTGSPLAHDERYVITNSDFLIWKPNANVFQASGKYQIVPINRPLAKNPSTP